MSNFLNKTFNKLVGGGGQSNKSTNSNSNSLLNQQNLTTQQLIQNQDTQLTLAHLRKVFYEYLHPKNELSQSEKDDKLYNILTLFIKVYFYPTSSAPLFILFHSKAFGQTSLIDIHEKFSDVNEFCFLCTKLLVFEIKKRVHDDLSLYFSQ